MVAAWSWTAKMFSIQTLEPRPHSSQLLTREGLAGERGVPFLSSTGTVGWLLGPLRSVKALSLGLGV